MYLIINFYLKDEDKNTFYFLINVIKEFKLEKFNHICT